MLLFAVSLCATQAAAQVPETVAQFAFGSSSCPVPDAVQVAVLGLIPPERHELLREGVRIYVEDLGESYRVTVSKNGKSVKKRYSDPARDCEGRARFAAVFSVLTLMPPELGIEPFADPEPVPESPPPAPPPAPVPPAAPSPPAGPEAPIARVELGFLYTHAPAILRAPALDAFGGELRVALGRGVVSGTLSVAYTSPAKFDIDNVQGELWRLPASAGVRVSTDLESWALIGDLDFLAVSQRVRATNLVTSRAQHSLDLGLRAGVEITRSSRATLSPFVAGFAWLSPSPLEIEALPRGSLGKLPYLWVGASAGVSLGL